MPRKILVPVDLSSDDPPELAFAAELARALGAQVILLHVVDYVPMLLPVELPGGYPLPQTDVIREAAASKLARMAAKVAGVETRTLCEIGGAAQEIVAAAAREQADQIVIGSHRHTAVARLVLGSVADRVAHTARCPVTIVRQR